MRVAWHPQAEDEMLEAARFYDQRVAGLGGDFLDAIDAAVDQITGDPQPLSKGRRRHSALSSEAVPLLRVFSMFG